MTGTEAARKRLRPALLGLALAVGAFAALSAPASAQETGGDLWGVGSCANCHGNLAAGDGDPAYPTGPSLRSTRLTPEEMVETIACGRPGTEMPYNLAGAYAEHGCYGIPVPTDPASLGANRGADFTAEQVQTLATFLVENVVGKTRITRENCALFFGGNADAPACRAF
ncbi:MAG: hypothetical protein IT535_14935 [Bauldia sp.]|nr:hypothetical protein [Bauldia sp.]